MASAPIWLFGLELTRFAPADDGADALAGSLTAIEAGGWTLSPYEGPALQPLVGLGLGRWELALAPAAALRRERAETADGREATLRSAALRLGLRLQAGLGPLALGLEGAVSDAWATLDGEAVAGADTRVELGPSLGVRAPLSERWTLGARARWPVAVTGTDITQDLSGALSLEWRGAGSR